MKELARTASAFAKPKGARALDACAIEADRPLMWGDGFVGIASVFRQNATNNVGPVRPGNRRVEVRWKSE